MSKQVLSCDNLSKAAHEIALSYSMTKELPASPAVSKIENKLFNIFHSILNEISMLDFEAAKELLTDCKDMIE